MTVGASQVTRPALPGKQPRPRWAQAGAGCWQKDGWDHHQSSPCSCQVAVWYVRLGGMVGYSGRYPAQVGPGHQARSSPAILFRLKQVHTSRL